MLNNVAFNHSLTRPKTASLGNHIVVIRRADFTGMACWDFSSRGLSEMKKILHFCDKIVLYTTQKHLSVRPEIASKDFLSDLLGRYEAKVTESVE